MSIGPKGVIAILTAPDGRVIAATSDFAPDRPGGCEIHEGQRYRVQRKLYFATVRAYCADAVTDAIDDHMADRICNALLRRGHKITYRAIGYPADVAKEIER